MPPISEREFMQQVIQLAKLCGFMVYHTHDSRRSVPGFPDLVCVGHGRVIYAELKTAKGRLTIEQTQWLAALEQAGAECHVFRPADFPRIQEVLRR